MLKGLSYQFLSTFNYKKKRDPNSSKYFSLLQKIKHEGYHYSSVVHVGVKGIIAEDSAFTCQRVLNYIDKNTGVRHTYDFTVGDREIVVNYVDYDDKPRSLFDRYTKMIIMVLHLLSHNSNTQCSKTLNIYIYLTDINKYLPRSRRTALAATHVNSGLSYMCAKHNHVGVYRKEEWFKTLIHELLHAFGADMNIRVTLPRVHTHSTLLVGEGYVEFWATYINAMITAFFITPNNEHKFGRIFTDFLESERRFSLIQANKILWHMVMRYRGFFRRDNHYKERTNAFAYFFIASFFWVNHRKFVEQCQNNNVNMVFVMNDQFIHDYIVSTYESTSYLSALQKYDIPYLNDSLRRSIIELE